MATSPQAAEIQRLLWTISQLATEIEQVPNFGPDVWTMNKVDQKCQQIRAYCQQIAGFIGTGDGGPPVSWGTGDGGSWGTGNG